ncbi:MAG: type II toxin-antitoxin system death-on-curing family toxin [Patescibacteria group bacterium]
MQTRFDYITLEEVEYVAHRLAQEALEWGEPIPHFGTRFPGILEQCLGAPRQTYAKRQLHKGLVSKAAVLFYLMIKNHPFQNGNKRVAVMTLIYFLYKNGQWLSVDNQELYNFAKWVAASNAKLKDETVSAVEAFIKMHVRVLDIRTL